MKIVDTEKYFQDCRNKKKCWNIYYYNYKLMKICEGLLLLLFIILKRSESGYYMIEGFVFNNFNFNYYEQLSEDRVDFRTSMEIHHSIVNLKDIVYFT